MQWMVLILIALVLLAAAGYAQYRTPYHTKTARDALWARLLLWVVGIAFGFVLATVYTSADGLEMVLMFLIGFGAVHVPAAFILFSKRRRGVTD